MTLEPRQVESGAVKRWYKEGWGLIRRGVGSWALLCLLAMLVSPLCLLIAPLPYFLGGLCCQGLRVAARADTRALGSGASFFRSKRLAIGAFLITLNFIMASGILLFIGWNALAANAAFFADARAGLAETPTVTYVVLGAFFANLVFCTYHLYFNCLNDTIGMFGYLAKTATDLGPEQAEHLLKRGYRINKHTLRAFYIGWGGLYSVCFILPIGWLLLSLYSASHYCAFRDIYLAQAENSPAAAKQEAAAPSPALVGSS